MTQTKPLTVPLPNAADYLSETEYQNLYQQSIKHPQDFWATQAKRFVTWSSPWESVLEGGFQNIDHLRWFTGAKLNACYNALDRHLDTRAQQVAILWQGDNPENTRSFTYAQLHQAVCRFANLLLQQGIQKGDRVCIYMPMIPEAAMAMLACARIGAIHSVVFAGFSPTALRNRLQDGQCKLLITADESVRGGKCTPLKQQADEALSDCPFVEKVIVVKHNAKIIPWVNSRDIDYHAAIKDLSVDCPITEMDANDPLFILYTSGSTGKPKGVLHHTGGYLVYTAMTFKYIFNYQSGDIYWCTADLGWITGHSYLLYGPLLNGAITLMFEGVPNYPTPSRSWEIIDKYQVNIFYTAPTAIRALMRHGDEPLKTSTRESLKLLGTVGEPINPEAWWWYFEKVGKKRCPIVDTWWQTETGGIMLSPLPGRHSLKPGATSFPCFGATPSIVDNQGQRLEGEQTGNLVITHPWPGMLNTIYGDRQRFMNTYMNPFPGYFFTGDEVHRDKDGYYWIIGRLDDVINVSGHRLGSAEIENVLVEHEAVTEAAVIGVPHPIKGESVYAFVTYKIGAEPSDEISQALINLVRHKISPIAQPDNIQWVNALPKTRSGKIMRRVLRKIVCQQTNDLGDISTLANPDVVQTLIRQVGANHQ